MGYTSSAVEILKKFRRNGVYARVTSFLRCIGNPSGRAIALLYLLSSYAVRYARALEEQTPSRLSIMRTTHTHTHAFRGTNDSYLLINLCLIYTVTRDCCSAQRRAITRPIAFTKRTACGLTASVSNYHCSSPSEAREETERW